MKDTQPTLHTERLRLRPFEATDAQAVQRLAGDHAIYATTANIPHPYEDGVAEAWIGSLAGRFQEGKEATFAAVRKEDGQLVGAIGLVLAPNSRSGELGYWIGRPHWNQGFATEAAQRLLAYAFEDLALHRVHAHHFRRNPASGRVMQKCGMVREGLLREHFQKDGHHEDIVLYGILQREWRFP